MNTTPRRAAAEAMSKPERTADQFAIHLAPAVYAMETSGACMEPIIHHGEKLEIHRDEEVRRGDLVVLYFRSHIQLSNGWNALVKRLVVGPPPGMTFPYDQHPDSTVEPIVIVEQVNPRKQYRIACTDILAMHRCVGTIDASRCYPAKLEELEA